MKFIFALLVYSSTWISAFSADGTRLLQGTANLSSQGNNHSSYPLVSRDGSTIVFESLANNLLPVPLTTKFVQIYAQPQGGSSALELVSIYPSGFNRPDDCLLADISRDGDVVLFESQSSNLTSPNGVINAKSIFARIRSKQQSIVISAGTDGNTPNGTSNNGVLSADGNSVLFESNLQNLTGTSAPNTYHNFLYLRNIADGKTIIVGTNVLDGSSAYYFSRGSLSHDGRFAAYGLKTDIANYVIVQDSTLNSNQYAWTNNSPSDVSVSCIQLSDDGRYLVFVASNLSNKTSSIYLCDLSNNAVTTVDDCLYIAERGDAPGPKLSPDGRFISYMLPPQGTNEFVGVWDRTTASRIVTTPGRFGKISSNGSILNFLGMAKDYGINASPMSWLAIQINRVAATTNLLSSAFDGSSQPVADVSSLSASELGNLVAFQSGDGNLVSGDVNGMADVFSRATNDPQCKLVSKSAVAGILQSGQQDVLELGIVTITNRNWTVVFDLAKSLLPSDASGLKQLVLIDPRSQTRILVSTNLAGDPSQGIISNPIFSFDGSTYAFYSTAHDLTTNVTDTGAVDLFVVDSIAGTTKNITASIPSSSFDKNFPLSAASITSDGSVIAFIRQSRDPNQSLVTSNYLYFKQTGILEAFANAGTNSPAISQDGSKIFYYSPASGLRITNRVSHSFAGPFEFNRSTNLVFSANGKFAFYQTGSQLNIIETEFFQQSSISPYVNPSFSTDGLSIALKKIFNLDLLVYNATNQTFELISENKDGGSGGNYFSDQASISPDGRFVVFRSRATNLVEGTKTPQARLYLRDRLTRTTTLFAGGTGDDDSTATHAFFSPDGKQIYYHGSIRNLPDYSADQTAALYYVNLATAPLVDTDHDGMDDQWEIQHFGNLDKTGLEDSDGDGATDLAEYLAGTDPNNASSVFKGLPATLDSQGQIVLKWKAVFGKSYKIQYKSALSDSQWLDLDAAITIVQGEGRAVDTATAIATKFYRILELP